MYDCMDKLFYPGESEAIKQMLSNKHLCELLQEIDQSNNPQRSLERAMNIPVFVEFADECSKIVGLNE